MKERKEILFSWMNTRCHAEIVEHESENSKFIGRYDDYEIYTTSVILDQFAFEAVKVNK